MDLKEKIGPFPKWAILAFAVAVFLGIGYYLLHDMLAPKEGQDAPAGNAYPTVPDAADAADEISATEAFEQQLKRGGNDVESVWERLRDNPGDGIGSTDNLRGYVGELDPNEYNEVEIHLIRNGTRSKESIDAEHAQRAREKAEREALEARERASRPKQLTQAQQDSQYFARIERAMAIAQKASAQASGVPGVPEPVAAEPEPDPTIDIEALRKGATASAMPVDALQDDGIISSLEDTSPAYSGADARPKSFKPVKATFLKSGKVTSGNRVIIRLLEDLTLADGMVIPSNTHITGYCSFKNRLKINVNMLHYNGRMFPVNISIYDNDGTEGLYCPLAISGKKKEKAAGQVANNALQSIGNIAGSVLMNNPFLGSFTSSNIQAITGMIGDDGVITVNVTSGYEFYVYESPKKEDSKDDRNG